MRSRAAKRCSMLPLVLCFSALHAVCARQFAALRLRVCVNFRVLCFCSFLSQFSLLFSSFRSSSLLFSLCAGHDYFVRLSTAFYDRVYADDDAKWFVEIFPIGGKADAIVNQYTFWVQ